MKAKSWRQLAKELPPIPKTSSRLEPVIPVGIDPSLERLIGYDRISAADKDPVKQELKLKRQQLARERLAEEAGMPIGAEFADPDHSGFYEELPPAFEVLLSVLPLWGGLVVYHPDRLTRNPIVAEAVIKVFADNPHLKFFTTGAVFDLSTLEGRQRLREMVGKAHWSSIDTSRRELATHSQLREAGQPSGKRGYGVKKDDRTQLDEDECAVIRQAVNDIFKGRTLKNIVDQWNVEGVRTAQGSYWTHHGLARMLRNPRLAGWRTVNRNGKAVVFVSELTGKPVRAVHPPIIDQDTFDLLQAALKARSRSAVNAENRAGMNLLSSLGQCGVCFATLHYGVGYLNCTKNGCVSIKAEPVEREIAAQCLDYWSKPLTDAVTADEPFAGQAELERLEAKKTETMGLFHADALTPSELAEALAPIRTRIAELEAERRRWIADTAKAKSAITNPVERWHETFAEPDGLLIRRDMIRSALSAFIVGKSVHRRDNTDGQYTSDLTRVHLVWR